MKRKNLEKAIIMGLLTTSISVPVWAADNEEVLGSQWQANNELTYNCDLKIEVTDEDIAKNKKSAIGPSANIDVGDNKLTLISDTYNAVDGGYGCNITVNAGSVDITAGENGIKTTEGYGSITFSNIKTNFKIVSGGQGIDNKTGRITVHGSDTSTIYINSQGYNGQENEDQAALNTGRNKDNTITDGRTFIEGGKIELAANGGSGIFTRTDNSSTELIAADSVVIFSNNINPETGEYKDKIKNAGIRSEAGTTNITAKKGGIEITSSQYGILSEKGEVNVTANTGNIIYAAKELVTTDDNGVVESQYYGRKHSIKAEGGSDVNMIATDGNNNLYGVIYAKDDGSVVNVSHDIKDDNGKVTLAGSGSNYIYSSAHGSKIEDEENNVTEDRSNVVAALYAQNQGKIEVIAGNGGINHIETYYANLDETNDDSERTVWAQRGGIIQIKGTTIIKSSNAEDFYDEEGYATNSRGVAITAGSGEIVADIPDGVRSTVNLEYGPEVKIDGETFKSAIYGDIVAGCGGWINIKKAVNDGQYGIDIQGNVLAANGGELTIDLGQGGTWYGRADDYQDADGGKLSFYNPVFSNQIESSGTVNIIMGEGSKWYLTGQSWVSFLDVTQGKGNVTIDMERFNEGTHGLTISELKGENGNGVDATFVMDLDHNSHSTSDMLYIKNATGEYDVVLNNVIDGMDKISEDNVLRFATVQGGASFNSVTLKDAGLYNLGFEVGHSEYDQTAETENKGYNGSKVDTNKPGNENVEGFFDLNKDSEDNTQKIMLMDTTDAAADPDSVQNWYITKVIGEDLSDGGKTVVNMSKVNYSNAVYMDRLNKRLGEARYINTEEDQGMWVRMRHDRIGKDNEFRIMNTMYELGYDEKQECDNGERRVGAAIDYMDGSSEYTGVGGSGDVSRKGIWLYDTWLGDKGHYSDFVAKWGHLSNDFTLYRGGDKITGDFSNNVYSISAEYGRKKDIGNNWYFEPQVQLQYARVTDANYTTSQGTEVSLDAINSLIARAGFRLGKDLGERSTVYFKADLLHEFLGDQDIYATDGTGTMDVTYGNEGTWCDIGFGFATAMSKTSYAYLDVETSLGNDYEETYQINAGLQWSF